MPTEKHPVPQHIMGIEFKLVGDLNVRQFFFLIGGGVLTFLVLRSGIVFYWKWPLAIFFSLTALIAAFVPLGGRRADQWIRNFFHAVFSPTQRIWKKSVVVPTFISDEFVNSLTKEVYSVAPQDERWRLKRFMEEFEEKEKKTKIDMEIDQFTNKLDFDQPLPESVELEISKKIEVPKYEKPEQKEEEKEKKRKEPEIKEKKKVKKKQAAKRKSITIEKEPTLAAEVNWSSENVITIPIAGAKKKKYVTTVSNVRPGRKMKNLPTIKGEIVMPVKGKTVIPPKDEPEGFKTGGEVETEIKKEPEIKKAPPQAKEETAAAEKKETKEESRISAIEPQTKSVKPDPVEQSEEEKKKSVSLKERIAQLTESIHILGERKEKAEKVEDDEQMVDLYQKQIDQLEEEKTSLLESVEDSEPLEAVGTKIAKQQSKEKEQEEKAKSTIQFSQKKKVYKKREEKEQKEKEVGEHHIIGAGPNIIYGIVKDSSGSVVPGAVVIIEDEEGNPVRALKTDRLGHFAIATRLPNGKYRVKVSKGDLNFDIMEKQLTGEKPPALEITATK